MFSLYAVDSRPMLFSPPAAPIMELCERFDTLEAAVDNAIIYWPEDGTVPLAIYNDKGRLLATLTPAWEGGLVIVQTEGMNVPRVLTAVQYARAGERIIGTTYYEYGCKHLLPHG